jgi:hypothetical protein
LSYSALPQLPKTEHPPGFGITKVHAASWIWSSIWKCVQAVCALCTTISRAVPTTRRTGEYALLRLRRKILRTGMEFLPLRSRLRSRMRFLRHRSRSSKHHDASHMFRAAMGTIVPAGTQRAVADGCVNSVLALARGGASPTQLAWRYCSAIELSGKERAPPFSGAVGVRVVRIGAAFASRRVLATAAATLPKCTTFWRRCTNM